MTQHGSFPGRQRGRRARPDNDVPGDVPDWAGYDAVPPDQREFPDLPPVRGQSGPRGVAPWHDQPWPAPAQDASQPQPHPQPYEHLQPQPYEHLQPHTHAHPQASGQRSPVQPQSARQQPEWAVPAEADPMESFSERWRRRGGETREERRADRRKQRRFLMIGGGATAVVIAVAVYFLTGGGGGNPAGVGLNSLITTFLPGEIQQVPNACDSVPSATLTQYLPGPPRLAAPPLNTGANSQCTWTLDKPPLYRVLEVNIQAYSPSGLASGDGSATFAAIDAYAEDEQVKQDPGPRSGQPKATVKDLSGMPGGNDTVAFQADQVFNVNGAVTDVATVVVRYRNVIVTVVMNGLDHANRGSYGPVSPAELDTAAQTVAQQVTGKLVR